MQRPGKIGVHAFPIIAHRPARLLGSSETGHRPDQQRHVSLEGRVKACRLPMTGLRFVAVVRVPHLASVQVAGRAVRTCPAPTDARAPPNPKPPSRVPDPSLRPSGARSKSAPPCSCLRASRRATGQEGPRGGQIQPQPQPNHYLTKPERVHVHPSKPTLTPRHRRKGYKPLVTEEGREEGRARPVS